MLLRKLALTGVFLSYGVPALAQSDFSDFRPKPRPITAIAVQGQQVELYAVTARARADTALRKDYHHECQSMAKVVPGYPPAGICQSRSQGKFLTSKRVVKRIDQPNGARIANQ